MAFEEQCVPFLEGFRPEQKDAIRATESLVVVSAGAGTGKTQTLATRFAWLLATDPTCGVEQIQVEQVDASFQYRIFCFDAVAQQGFLRLEVPSTLSIRSGNDPVQATVSPSASVMLQPSRPQLSLPYASAVTSACVQSWPPRCFRPRMKPWCRPCTSMSLASGSRKPLTSN